MSTISQIKQQVNQIASTSASSASQLIQLAGKIEKNAAAINSAISGTASGSDKKMVAAFEEASKAVKEAAQLLQAASQSAKDWVSKA